VGSQQEDTLLLRPRRAQPAYRLYFLFTQGSPEFDLAVETVLWIYLERGVWVEAALALLPEAYSYTAGGRALALLQAAQAAGYDLVYAVGPEATRLVYENYRAETGLLPVVTLQAKDPVLLGQVADYTSGSGVNIAYTSLNVPLDVQMAYFRQLLPELHNIVVLYDFSNTSSVKTQVEPLGSYALQHDLNLVYVPVFNLNDPQAARAELRGKFPNVMNDINHADPFSRQSLLLVTNSSLLSQVFDVVDALAGRIPVVSLLPELVRAGDVSALLSVGVTLDGNAGLAAAYGLRILQEGVPPGELPVGVLTPPDVAINFAKARELGLRIPFTLFERATTIYDAQGRLALLDGQAVALP
jgi:putative ABC transport system substrate-binding protein